MKENGVASADVRQAELRKRRKRLTASCLMLIIAIACIGAAAVRFRARSRHFALLGERYGDYAELWLGPVADDLRYQLEYLPQNVRDLEELSAKAAASTTGVVRDPCGVEYTAADLASGLKQTRKDLEIAKEEAFVISVWQKYYRRKALVYRRLAKYPWESAPNVPAPSLLPPGENSVELHDWVFFR
jgi:hypothetical protein